VAQRLEHLDPRALSGPLATSAAWRRVRARDTAISNVLGPFGPRPEPLLMSPRRVNQPAGGDAGEGDWARRTSGCGSFLFRGCGVGERAGRSRGLTPAAALRGEHPQREQGQEDHQSDRGTVTVKRDDSLLGRVAPATVAGRIDRRQHRKAFGYQVTESLSRATAGERSSRGMAQKTSGTRRLSIHSRARTALPRYAATWGEPCRHDFR
jgi:hypothetical protein